MGDFLDPSLIEEFLRESGLPDVVVDMLSDYTLDVFSGILNIILELIARGAIWLLLLVIGAVATVVGVIALTILSLVSYIFRSIGLMRIAKKLGVKHRFLAWIPFASDYLVGVCAEKSIARNGKKPWKWGAILILTFTAITVGMPVVRLVASTIVSVLPPLVPVVNLILSSARVIYLGLYCYALFRIFKEFSGTTGGVIFTLCALFLGILEGIFVFIVSCLKLRDPATAALSQDDVVLTDLPQDTAAPADLPVQIKEDEQDPFA